MLNNKIMVPIDPAYCEKSVPNLDGCEGHSDHIIFGSNIDVSVPSENSATHLATGQAGEKSEAITPQEDAPTEEPIESTKTVEEQETKTSDSEHAAKL